MVTALLRLNARGADGAAPYNLTKMLAAGRLKFMTAELQG